MEDVVLQLTRDEAFELLDWIEEEALVYVVTADDTPTPTPTETLLGNVYDKLQALLNDLETE